MVYMNDRYYNWIDQALMQLDVCMTTLFSETPSKRSNPAANLPEPPLTKAQQQYSASLMRVNHSGEICAQALYEGQLLVARMEKMKDLLQKARDEEIDHLKWTQQRIKELNGHCSYLNGFWYFNSLLIGMLAGLSGDRWSLGFIEETEHQVSKHLEDHLGCLPEADMKSRKIVEQMHIDEAKHGQAAANAGANELPSAIKKLMFLHAKVMTTLTYWI